MARLQDDSLILGYADDLIAEYKAAAGPVLDLESLQGRLADTLEKIVRYVREDASGDR